VIPVSAAAGFSSLSAAHARGMMSVLRADKVHLSPVLGLLSVSSSVLVGNIYRCGATADLGMGLAHAHLLAKDLFHPVGDDIRATRSGSQAANYLTPAALGHILGLALTHAPSSKISATLKEIGIKTNKFQNEWTGVSLSRYIEIVQLLKDSIQIEWSPAIPLLLRLVWEKSRSKQCVLDFLLALHSHYPILVSGFSENTHGEWLELRFNSSELSDDAVVSAAKAVVSFDGEVNHSEFTHSMELLSASLSRVHAFKPAVAMQRHQYKSGTKIIGDCVEVVLREIFDLLLFDPEQLLWVPSRLPPTASPALLAFYQAIPGDVTKASQDWYNLCQELRGCDYIEKTPQGEPYELFPSLPNVAKAAGALLGQEWTSLQQFEDGWNALRKNDQMALLTIQASQAMSRNLLNDEKALREMAEFKLGMNHHFIRICLEGTRHFASVTHCQISNVWRDEVKELHMQAFLTSSPTPSSSARCLQSLWPLVLGSSMLAHLQQQQQRQQVQSVYSILCAPLNTDRLRWLPTQDFQSGANVDLNSASSNKLRSEETALTALHTLVACDHAKCDDTAPLASDSHQNISTASEGLLPWMLTETHSLSAVRIATALRGISRKASESLRTDAALSGRPDGVLLARMLEISSGNWNIFHVCRKLTISQTLQVGYFWLKSLLSKTRGTF